MIATALLAVGFAAAAGPATAEESLRPRLTGGQAEEVDGQILGVLGANARRRFRDPNSGLPALTTAAGSLEPLRQSLQLPGLMGGSLALRVERGGFQLPSLDALRLGEHGVYGTAAGSQRMELSADALQIGSDAKLGAKWLRFTGSRGGGERLALSLSSGRLRVSGLRQQLDAPLRPGRDVSAADAALFANELGMKRSGLDLRFQAGAKDTLALTQTRLTASRADAGVQRLTYSGKNDLALSFESGAVDRTFDRAAALPEAEKVLFTREKGFRWQDLSARFRTASWSALELTSYRSRATTGAQERTRERLAWTLTPSRSSRLLLSRETTAQQANRGRAQTATTQSAQWDQTLAKGIAFRALREHIERDTGARSTGQERQLLALRANPKSSFQWSAERETITAPGGGSANLKLTLARALAANWKLQGTYARLAPAKAREQTNYQASLTGLIGKRVQLSASSLQRAAGNGSPARKESVALTTTPGALGRALSRTRVSLELASASRLPLAVAPTAKRAPARRPAAKSTDWRSLGLITETTLRRSLLTLGLQSFELPAGRAGGAVYGWRSTDKGPLQWELRHNWIELPTGLLVPRERAAVSYAWGKSRLVASTELNPEPAPGKPLLGQQQSAVEMQLQAGHTRFGLAFGETEDRVRGTATAMRRFTMECALSHKGVLQAGYETNTPPTPTPTLPEHHLTLVYRQEFAPDRRIDLQADLRHWDSDKIPDELTWRLDLLVTF